MVLGEEGGKEGGYSKASPAPPSGALLLKRERGGCAAAAFPSSLFSPPSMRTHTPDHALFLVLLQQSRQPSEAKRGQDRTGQDSATREESRGGEGRAGGRTFLRSI